MTSVRIILFLMSAFLLLVIVLGYFFFLQVDLSSPVVQKPKLKAVATQKPELKAMAIKKPAELTELTELTEPTAPISAIVRGWDPSFTIRRAANYLPALSNTFFQLCPDGESGLCYPNIAAGGGFWTLSTDIGGALQSCLINTNQMFTVEAEQQPCPFSFSWSDPAGDSAEATLGIDTRSWSRSVTPNVYFGFHQNSMQEGLYFGGNNYPHIDTLRTTLRLRHLTSSRPADNPHAEARILVGVTWYVPSLNQSFVIEMNLGNVPQENNSVTPARSSEERIGLDRVEYGVRQIYLGGPAWGLPRLKPGQETVNITIDWHKIIQTLIQEGRLPAEVFVHRPATITVGIEQWGRLENKLIIEDLRLWEVVK